MGTNVGNWVVSGQTAFSDALPIADSLLTTHVRPFTLRGPNARFMHV